MKSDVPPLEDMSGLIDEVNKLREEVSPGNSVVSPTKMEDTQVKRIPESSHEVMLNLHHYAMTPARSWGIYCSEYLEVMCSSVLQTLNFYRTKMLKNHSFGALRTYIHVAYRGVPSRGEGEP